ncbi:MAG: hypothetical protein RLZZ244_1534 [Verrucomicrobiota bacterium]
MATYGAALSETFRTPPGMFLLSMLAAVAGAAGKGWQLGGAVSGHKNWPNLFVLLALPTGSQKSVSSRILKPVTDRETERIRQWEETDRPVLEGQRRLAEERLKEALREQRHGSEGGMDVGKLQKEVARLTRESERNPALMLGNVTTAALAKEISRMDHETAMLFSPEGGDLLRVALGLYRERGMDADLLLSGFTGESYGQSRAGSGTLRLECPLISMLGMIQPMLLREAFANEEAAARGLLGRFLSVPFEHPLVEDDGQAPEVCQDAEENWNRVLSGILDARIKQSRAPLEIGCSPEARKILRGAHNRNIQRLNADAEDIRNWLIRFREQCCRVALCFHIVTDRFARELKAQTAICAVRVVDWMMGQTVDMLSSSRAETRKQRLEQLLERVPKTGEVTVRELKRAGGFSEGELRQLCAMSGGVFEMTEHRSPGGGPVSLRVLRK